MPEPSRGGNGMIHNITLKVNGREVTASVESQTTLLKFLKGHLQLTGTKEGCEQGECGACTVLLDGKPVNACLTLAVKTKGREVTTIEGLGDEKNLHPLQRAFIDTAALQCGYCGPGVLLTAKAFLDENPSPTEREVRAAISGHLCRCTGYQKMVEAILKASQEMNKEKHQTT